MPKHETSTVAGSYGPPVWVAAALLAFAIALVYGSARHAPFIFDDRLTITENETITSLWPLVGTAEHPGPLNSAARTLPTASRPLVNLSFALNYFANGIDPAGYHITNMLIHFLSAILVFSITVRTLQLPRFAAKYDASAGWLALTAAMLWALHPLQTEAVIYTTQRTELMMALFYLATLYCSLRYWGLSPAPREGSNGTAQEQPSKHLHRMVWGVLAVLACLAGMASKEVMASAPLVLLFYERTFVAGSLKEALRRSWPLYLGLVATWILVWRLSLGAPHGTSAGFGLEVAASAWWLTQAKVVWLYLKLAIWPWPLLIHYQFPYLVTFGDAWIYVVPLLVLVTAIVVLLWRNHPVGFVGAWVFAILSPTLVVPIITEMAAERRMYLPLVALVVLFVLCVYELGLSISRRWLRDPRSSRGLHLRPGTILLPAVLLSVVFALVSARRLDAYGNEMRLWQEVVRFQPDDYMAHDNLGHALTEANRVPEALSELQIAVALKPNYFNARNNLGAAQAKAGQLPEAIQSFQAALALEPDHTLLRNNLGVALMRAGRYPEAIEHLQYALKLQPGNVEARNSLGNTYMQAGRLPEAIEELRGCLLIAPDHPYALLTLGNALMFAGDYQKAVEPLEHAARVKSGFAEAHNNAGVALTHTGRIPQAVSHYEQALAIDPNYDDAHYNLARALVNAGQRDKAIPHLERVVQKPGYMKAYPVLVQALAAAGREKEAVTTAQNGIVATRAAGLEDSAQRLEEWLKHFQRELQRSHDSTTVAPQPTQPPLPNQ